MGAVQRQTGPLLYHTVQRVLQTDRQTHRVSDIAGLPTLDRPAPVPHSPEPYRQKAHEDENIYKLHNYTTIHKLGRSLVHVSGCVSVG